MPCQITLPFLYWSPIQVLAKQPFNSPRGYQSRVLHRNQFTRDISSFNLHPALLHGYGIHTSRNTNSSNNIITLPSLLCSFTSTSFTPISTSGHSRFWSMMARTTTELSCCRLSIHLRARVLEHVSGGSKRCAPAQTTNKNTQFLQYHLPGGRLVSCHPYFGPTRVLDLFLSDTTRYLQLANRLPRLEHVLFALNMVFNRTCRKGPVKETMHLRKVKAVQDVVQFVQEHHRIFPEDLKYLVETCSGVCLKNSSMTCKEIYAAVSDLSS
ncbi:MAG: hypothetical protein J3R72DRAFT_22397 [Linnemannia gamsii]|nr:MAG: hypothetical protein J3R72DRAFT_22397 [Linnemannia gamsii]